MGPDPGPCPICDTPHCACGAGGPITVAPLPARDAARTASVESLGASAVGRPAGDAAADVPAPPTPDALGDGSDDRPFSTATYRGRKKKRS